VEPRSDILSAVSRQGRPVDGDRVRGALIGTALGDAMGAPFEGRARVERGEVETLLESTSTLTWTDDTHMALTLGEAVVVAGDDLDAEALGDLFARAYRAEPWRGYGAGPPQVFAMAEAGRSYLDAAASLFAGTGSYGNGAAMRAAPAGIAAGGDLARAARLAGIQARVTHAHPEGVDGAVVVACGVTTLLEAPADPVAALTGVLHHLATDAFRAPMRRVLEAAGPAERLAVARAVGSGVAARASVPAAVAAYLAAWASHPGDGVEAIVTAVTLGGDTDTVAAMAGALTGAHLGASGLPERLVSRIEQRRRIEALADRLADPAG